MDVYAWHCMFNCVIPTINDNYFLYVQTSFQRISFSHTPSHPHPPLPISPLSLPPFFPPSLPLSPSLLPSLSLSPSLSLFSLLLPSFSLSLSLSLPLPSPSKHKHTRHTPHVPSTCSTLIRCLQFSRSKVVSL